MSMKAFLFKFSPEGTLDLYESFDNQMKFMRSIDPVFQGFKVHCEGDADVFNYALNHEEHSEKIMPKMEAFHGYKEPEPKVYKEKYFIGYEFTVGQGSGIKRFAVCEILEMAYTELSIEWIYRFLINKHKVDERENEIKIIEIQKL